jgi:hypothetical protein
MQGSYSKFVGVNLLRRERFCVPLPSSTHAQYFKPTTPSLAIFISPLPVQFRQSFSSFSIRLLLLLLGRGIIAGGGKLSKQDPT